MKYFYHKRLTLSYRLLSVFVVFTFACSLVVSPVQAQTSILNLPSVGMMVKPTASYTPVIIKGMTVYPENPLRFDFMMDTGDTGMKLDDEEFKQESRKLIKYFLTALTVPEKDLWVNLSPYEKDRIIPKGFDQTEMGRDLLAQDYILKQLTSSLMYPEDELGKKFWDKIYEEAFDKYGTIDIPINTFNKVWIVPEKAKVYQQGNSAFVIDRKLKVMLEEDYVAMQYDQSNRRGLIHQTLDENNVDVQKGVMNHTPTNNNFQTNIIRQIIIPAIEKEVNQGKHFIQLRQIYDAMILATWYKNTLQESLLGQVYVDQNKIKGVDVEDKEIKHKIYNQYVEAFKKGVYDYIREDFDPATQEIIPRKYFSGGASFGKETAFGGIDELFKKSLVVANSLLELTKEDQNLVVSSSEDIGLQGNVMWEAEKSQPKSLASSSLEDNMDNSFWNNQKVQNLALDLLHSGLENFKEFSVGDLDVNVPEKLRVRIRLGESSIFEHKTTGLQIIRNYIEDTTRFQIIKEFANERRRYVVPIFFLGEDQVDDSRMSYFSLNLIPFGYITLEEAQVQLTNELREKILRAAIDSFRFNLKSWFIHRHLHHRNILLKFDEQGEVEDIKFIDWRLLEKMNIPDEIVSSITEDSLRAEKADLSFISEIYLPMERSAETRREEKELYVLSISKENSGSPIELQIEQLTEIRDALWEMQKSVFDWEFGELGDLPEGVTEEEMIYQVNKLLNIPVKQYSFEGKIHINEKDLLEDLQSENVLMKIRALTLLGNAMSVENGVDLSMVNSMKPFLSDHNFIIQHLAARAINEVLFMLEDDMSKTEYAWLKNQIDRIISMRESDDESFLERRYIQEADSLAGQQTGSLVVKYVDQLIEVLKSQEIDLLKLARRILMQDITIEKKDLGKYVFREGDVLFAIKLLSNIDHSDVPDLLTIGLVHPSLEVRKAAVEGLIEWVLGQDLNIVLDVAEVFKKGLGERMSPVYRKFSASLLRILNLQIDQLTESKKELDSAALERILEVYSILEKDKTSSGSSPIKTNRKGGIDLNSAALDLQVEQDKNRVPLQMEFKSDEYMNIEGFSPVIINIVPISIPALLGLNTTCSDKDGVDCYDRSMPVNKFEEVIL